VSIRASSGLQPGLGFGLGGVRSGELGGQQFGAVVAEHVLVEELVSKPEDRMGEIRSHASQGS
jgi:hypothetical protein